ncbi:hypothetical protein BH10PSE19_BH10PSE19_05970 [soil metagenome]
MFRPNNRSPLQSFAHRESKAEKQTISPLLEDGQKLLETARRLGQTDTRALSELNIIIKKLQEIAETLSNDKENLNAAEQVVFSDIKFSVSG